MIESYIPAEYLQYFEFPDVQKIINVAISLTPLYTYGTACWSIFRKQTLVGFSLDICATMLMASVLRILYYFVSPYEPSLLRQSLVMVVIQCVLLKVSLKYRPSTYNPDTLAELPDMAQDFSRLPKLSSSQYQYDNPRFFVFLFDLAWQYCRIWAEQILRLFDVYYQRPGKFWQWIDEYEYWRFILVFGTIFSVLTVLFRESEGYGSFIGILGLFIESLLPLPQILMLQRLQTVRNFKMILLVSWLCGDLLKLSYLFFGTSNISFIFIFAGLFQMSLDLVIVAQYIHFRKLDQDLLPLYEEGPEFKAGSETYDIEMATLGIASQSIPA